jgi:hypothetical protein
VQYAKLSASHHQITYRQAGPSISLFTTIRTEKKNSMADALSYITSFSELMRKSIRYDMLTVRRESIQETLEFFGTSESIEGVRILNHSGRIFYSSTLEEVGNSIEKNSLSCTGCHNGDDKPLQALLLENRWAIYEKPDGSRAMTFAEPIYNEPDCYTAACHTHGSEQKVLGILLTDFSFQAIDNRISNQIAEHYIMEACAKTINQSDNRYAASLFRGHG